jgi:hypothetical protein
LHFELLAGLTEDGGRHSDVEPVARIALGRAALTSGPLEQAVLATVLDYLTCAATLHHTRPGFAGRLLRGWALRFEAICWSIPTINGANRPFHPAIKRRSTLAGSQRLRMSATWLVQGLRHPAGRITR